MKVTLHLLAQTEQDLIFKDDQGFELSLPLRYFKHPPIIGQSVVIDFDHQTSAEEILQSIFHHHDQSQS